MSATTKKILIYLALGLLVALVGIFVFGNIGGGLFGLWSLLPATQAKLQEKKLEGERAQAEQDRAAAQAQREELRKKFILIDNETAKDVTDIEKKWDGVSKDGPTPEQEAEMLKRFAPKPEGK